MTTTTFIVVLLAAGLQLTQASPKKYQPEEGGFLPSNNRYYESNLPTYNGANETRGEREKEAKDGDKLRFGISSFGGTGSGAQAYPGGAANGVNYMISPMKIDIGGIVLGALIGLGTILVVPKIAQALSGGYGYRSLENDMSSITDALSRLDNSLEQHNIDSSSCMQRVICSYVTDAKKNMENGEANTVDQLIYAISSNPLFTYMLDGTAIKEAVNTGKAGDIDKCATFFSKCPITRDNILKIVSNLLPA